MIKITTDSTSDLPKELLSKYNIDLIPLYVMLGDKEYIDGVNVNQEMIYDFVKETNILPKTAARSVVDYVDFFDRNLQDGDTIIHIGLGAEISSSYRNAVMASEEINSNRVFVFDSKSLSSGIGLLVLEAVRLAQDGENVETILNYLKRIVDKVQTSFVVDTLDYLYKGGRCSKFSFSVGSLLKIKPKIEVLNGVMVNTGKDLGPIKIVLKKYIDDTLAKYPCRENGICFLAHSLKDEQTRDFLYNYVKSKGLFREVYLQDVGSVISCHCGPGTMGMFYIEK